MCRGKNDEVIGMKKMRDGGDQLTGIDPANDPFRYA